jgi:hypothetical protein
LLPRGGLSLLQVLFKHRQVFGGRRLQVWFLAGFRFISEIGSIPYGELAEHGLGL